MLRINKNLFFYIPILSIFLSSCGETIQKKLSIAEKYQMHCGSCHLAPAPENITKSLWKNNVLPVMGGKMGYLYNGYDPNKGKSFNEQYHILKNKIYPTKPIIDSISWWQIHDYIISLAPDSIPFDTARNDRNRPLKKFAAKPIDLEGVSNPDITNIDFDTITHLFNIGGRGGTVHEWSLTTNKLKDAFKYPITSYIQKGEKEYITEIGIMNPNEIPIGTIYSKKPGHIDILANQLHRPVFTKVADVDDDGIDEVLVCEFGDLSGELSIFELKGETYKKSTLLPLPGAIKLDVTDINKDGKKDIIVLMTQGNEGIYILYQTDKLQFEIDQVIKLPPEYGSSWFEIIDYNKDGHLDIVLANGDNADFSIFFKPYHGIRMFINDGTNQFEQKWFYPIYGATKVLSADFDMDDDLDFVVTAFFSGDNNSSNDEGFVFLENKSATSYDFQAYTLDESVKKSKWLAMDKGDIDNDGDLDILLGAFKIPNFNKNPLESKKEEIPKLWFLENQTISK